MARNNPVLVGSSATVRLSDRKLAARTVKSKSTRTGELWAAYDDSAEIQHSVRYRGDLIERVQFYVAVTASGQRQATPVFDDDGTPAEGVSDAIAALASSVA